MDIFSHFISFSGSKENKCALFHARQKRRYSAGKYSAIRFLSEQSDFDSSWLVRDKTKFARKSQPIWLERELAYTLVARVRLFDDIIEPR